jgi:asparagine synthase (glutamine-hydrolysing)
VHRRLSIIDLSAAGHQPMLSADGRYVISYNGEVYSFRPIADELAARGHKFRGHSDTEVILESFAVNGIEATLKRMIGMFAIALWDRRDRTLTLMRDRLGIKPLYWAKFGNTFLFGSELKALRAHPGWTPRIDQSAVAAFMRHNYIPAPRTIYEGVHKLEPGTVLTLPWRSEPNISRFWDARSIARDGSHNPVEGSDAELTEQLESLLKDAVSRRMIADVPLGAFLSGGVDSSTVVALMQAAKSGTVKSFSIGFDIEGYNEAPHAAAVARHLQTDHTELTVTSKEALDVIPRLADFYDEPFADSSQIPTYLVSAMTRKYVTVALSGDGGDELFAGYNRYQLTQRFWRSLSLMPRAVRKGAAAALTAVRPDRWTQILSALPSRLRPPQAGDKVHKAAAVLRLDSADAVYRRLVSHWEPSEIMPQVAEPRSILDDATVAKDFPDLLERMQFLDLVTYLPDDILTKVDRASMAVALEARVPLIDHRVVEFAWRLPENVKVRNGTSKWLLRQVLNRHVPSELIERPKMGFGIPLGEWLRGPLRDWAETLLNEQRLRQAGLLDAGMVRRYWADHLDGRRNWQYLIWDVLMLEAWRERWA